MLLSIFGKVPRFEVLCAVIVSCLTVLVVLVGVLATLFDDEGKVPRFDVLGFGSLCVIVLVTLLLVCRGCGRSSSARLCWRAYRKLNINDNIAENQLVAIIYNFFF